MVQKPLVVYLEVNDFSHMPEYFMENYHTHLCCLQGRIEFRFKGTQMRCCAGEFLFWFARSKVSEIRFSENFRGSVLLVEKDFLNGNLPDQSWSIAASLYSRDHPVKKLTDETRNTILENFGFLYQRFTQKQMIFYDEILRLQLQIFIMEMWNIFSRDYERRAVGMQGSTLYERFIILLEQNCQKERQVQFYADKLNITPKYLNLVSKKASGIAASEWIRRYAVEYLLVLLENRNLNISEIAEEMAFSSATFFTRYMKKSLGVTPGQFRKRML